jgi:hypothetical protein
MNIEQTVMEKLKILPMEQQQKVLDFIDIINKKSRIKQPYRNLKGLWKDLNIEITEKDITEARLEVWADFSKEDF